MKKYIISFCLVFSLMFLSLVSPFKAEESDILDGITDANYEVTTEAKADKEVATKKEEKQIEQLFEEYSLEPLTTELPANTPVVNFDSVEEFKKFLEDTNKPTEIEINEHKSENDQLFASLFGIKTADAAMKTYKYSEWHGASKLNLYADVNRNSKGKVTDTDVWTTLTGITLGFAWDEKNAYAILNSSKTGGTAYGRGTFSYVIFIQGIGTIYSYDIKMSLKF
ncbi:hypothetical protein [Bacillus sp. OTU2372]|uniref:hypothetical protein n=1 Tax=Bacillus sp. OTU2372 TaxID=3043858 RepID=UPI00313EC27C